MSAERTRSLRIVILTAIASVALYYTLPADMNELARRTMCVFLVAAVFWATEALPLYATSLCVIGLEILFLADKGGLAHVLPARSAFPETGSLAATDFLQSFSSPIIILFMGGFLISSSVTKHGLDKVIAAKLIRPFARKPLTLLFGVLGITAFFSMWMSNTATAAMMLAIIVPLAKGLPEDDRFHRGLILAVPFGANIGGIGTPIGSPPNAVALAALRMAGYPIGFLDWMVMALPLALLMLLTAGLVLHRFFPPSAQLTLPDLHAGEKLSPTGRVTLGVLALTIVLWLTSGWHGVSDAVVALLAAAGLTAMRVLDRRDVDSIDWNVLILMWGGLSLGDAMQRSGLVDYIVALPLIDQLAGAPLMMVGFVVVLAVVLSTFMSNTAAAALIVPMAISLSPGDQGALAILTALACSFAMAMPVSTPPNAIAFASGRIPASSMVRSGGVISVIGVAVLIFGSRAVLPMFLAMMER